MKKNLLFSIFVLCFVTMYGQVPTNGLIAWYPFSGNTVDSSGNGNNGTNYGATLTTDRFGQFGKAYYFNGSTQSLPYISAPNPLTNSLTAFSISYWFKRSDITNDAINMTFSDFQNTFEWWLNKNFTLGFRNYSRINQGLIFQILTPENWDTSHWYHMVVTSNLVKSSIFIDGNLVNTSNTNAVLPTGTLFIGKHDQFTPSQGYYFNGKIDDIRIYNRVLASNEVKLLYNEVGSTNPLPVEILTFSGQNKNGVNNLNWNTADEINTSYFNIERSLDGSSFYKIGSVTAKGFGNNEYNYNDLNLKEASDIIYYRLKIIDKDGKFTYSKIVMINGENTKSFSIAPNPAKKYTTINLNGIIGKASVKVLDISGKVVVSDNMKEATKPYILNTQSLSRGFYVIEISAGTSKYTEKLFVD